VKRGNNWRGGVSQRADGYRSVWMPDHPNADKSGRVLEHVVVAARALGRPIPSRVVIHHVNSNPAENRGANLVICEDHAYHMLLHQRMRAREACGNPGWLKCQLCKEYDAPENLTVSDVPGRNPYHRRCHARYSRERRKRQARQGACS
jgi:hypothetical protein